eukprot:PITA_31186
MEKVGYGKWAIWMAITVLLSLLADNVIAQSGFLSVDCAGKENYTDENKIAWVTDASYIDVGETAVTGNATLPSYLQRLRFFPKPLNKSCYRLPVSPNVPYLLRLWFSLGNYSGFSSSYPNFNYSIETSGLLIHSTMSDSISFNHEGIYVSSGEVLYVCLIRSRDADDPFINAIELRTLQNGMYSQAKSGTMLFKQERADLGGNSIVRYPRDNFDRIWKPDRSLTDSSSARNVSSKEPIFSDSTKNHPPTAVMQTAWVMNIDDFSFKVPTAPWAKSLLLLYLAELETLNTSESTSFYVTINGEYRSENGEYRPEAILLVRNYSALELTFISNEANEFIFHLVKDPRSTNHPIINAFEYYTIHPTQTATNSQDIEALDAIKSKYGIKGWISDPCYLRPWNGLGCVNSSLAIRISEINLSGRNLTGSVPEEIGQLTALVNVSLENNNLIGPLPDLSGLIMLERLHLQNNSLNGSLPDWLFNLNNLKELFLQNNNFSGVIPGQLFYKTSLNAIFTGNNYLCISKAGECVGQIQETRSNSKRVNLGTILGITISGGLFALAMGGAIAVYRRKLRKRQRHDKDDTIKVPQLEKYPCFTVKDMAEATEDFSQEIGQGNSGKVFHGKLQDGRDVAVKRFSTIPQFLNEADVLPKAQNKNLMPLHGYCNESKNPMLIYEHMSGGSLSDKLHGKDVSGHSNLDWKTRLNIALNVAQGLEFMHAGCTPKIIHRDVKTANILLDNNMNAKLADFGISKIAMDGQASHATTAMAKGTPGYIAPEYLSANQVTEKIDVYSFGVVLFEMICGRKAADESLPAEESNLIKWVTPYVKDEKADPKIIDKRLGGNYKKESIDRVAKLALRCVDDTPSLRPSMTDVVGDIKDAITLEKENNAQFPDPKENDIQYGDSRASPVRSLQDSGKSEDMEWVADSSEVRPLA